MAMFRWEIVGGIMEEGTVAGGGFSVFFLMFGMSGNIL